MKIVIAIAGLAVVGAVGAFGYHHHINTQAQEGLDNYLEELTASHQFSAASYDSISVSFGGTVTIERVSLTPIDSEEAVVIQHVEAFNIDLSHDVPHTMNVIMSGIELNEKAQVQLAGDNAALGQYLRSIVTGNVLPFNAEMSYVYNEADEKEQNTQFSFGLDDVARYEMFIQTKNIPIELMFQTDRDDPAAQAEAMQAVYAASLPSFSVSIEDLGGVNSLMKIYAEEAQVSEEELREQMIEGLSAMALQMLPPGLEDFSHDSLAELNNFLLGGKRLSVALSPAHDGNIEKLQPELMSAFMEEDFEAIIELLQLEVVAM
ncbi:MAG: hypothetical protein ACI93R_003516 [Flavobacteriales bacterium]|jgi:hypothetical protein